MTGMPGDANATSDFSEVVRTTRGFRRFRDEPVAREVIVECLEAATWAPSGGNQQPWRFVILESAESRAVMAQGARRALETIASSYRLERPAPDDQSKRARMARDLFDLHEGAATVPAAVLFCCRPLVADDPLLVGASIYPAMQNFLLAARSKGLGTLVTGWHVGAREALIEVVGVPEPFRLAALVVAGYPVGRFGPVRRKPIGDVVAIDTWDHALPG